MVPKKRLIRVVLVTGVVVVSAIAAISFHRGFAQAPQEKGATNPERLARTLYRTAARREGMSQSLYTRAPEAKPPNTAAPPSYIYGSAARPDQSMRTQELINFWISLFQLQGKIGVMREVAQGNRPEAQQIEAKLDYSGNEAMVHKPSGRTVPGWRYHTILADTDVWIFFADEPDQFNGTRYLILWSTDNEIWEFHSWAVRGIAIEGG